MGYNRKYWKHRRRLLFSGTGYSSSPIRNGMSFSYCSSRLSSITTTATATSDHPARLATDARHGARGLHKIHVVDMVAVFFPVDSSADEARKCAVISPVSHKRLQVVLFY